MNLVEAINAAWTRDTSANPDEWSDARRSRGQCAVTALVVQDHLGGELLRAEVNGESHYWNRLADGSEIDLTRDQFPHPQDVSEPVVRERSYVLSFPATARRYDLLRERIAPTAYAPNERSSTRLGDSNPRPTAPQPTATDGSA